MVISGQVINEPQSVKVPHLRNLYRKQGLTIAAGPQKTGFGFTHDGAIDNLTSFLQLSQFNSWPTSVKDDLVQFLLAFDTGTAPTVGYQVTIDQGNAGSPSTSADLGLLVARALANDIDLVAQGSVQGALHGLLFDTAGQTFRSDTTGLGPWTQAQLTSLLQTGAAALTFSGVAPGQGTRIALDRDLDGVLDGDEAAVTYGAGTAGCAGMPRIAANSEPRLGNVLFAWVGENAPPSGFGFLMLGFAQTSQPVAGIQLLVDPAIGPPVVVFVGADARATATWPLPIPAAANYANVQLCGQFAWLDACGPAGLSATPGLRIVTRPQ